MKLKYWIAAIGLVSVILVIEYDIVKRTEAQISVKKTNATSPVVEAQRAPQEASTAVVNTLPTPKTFAGRFKFESESIAHLQADPAEIERRLESLALAMTPADINNLSKVMLDPNQSGDERALAVEVLSRKKTPESLQALENFVKNHEATTKKNWSRSQEFESVLRAQAIEGIAAYPQKDSALTSLNSLSEKVEESFLLDRIMRSSESVKGKAAATEVQDDAALRQLVE